MEKGFNDDELADIMNEIEALEKEFTHDDEESTETVEAKVEEHHEPVHHEEVAHHEEPVAEHIEEKEVLSELSKMPVEEVVPKAKHHEVDENIHHIHEPVHHQQKSSAHTAMSFHVEGDMKFDLSFHISGKYVGLTVTEHGLEIGLDGGVKFTVPVQEGHKVKKAS